jgi:hypothetical protein
MNLTTSEFEEAAGRLYHSAETVRCEKDPNGLCFIPWDHAPPVIKDLYRQAVKVLTVNVPDSLTLTQVMVWMERLGKEGSEAALSPKKDKLN